MWEKEVFEISCDINLNTKDIQYIIDIQYQIINGTDDIYVIRFTDSKFLNAAVSVLIGTLPVYAKLLGKKVFIAFEDIKSPVLDFIKKVGIYDYFNSTHTITKYVKQKALPFDRITNEEMMETYTDKIMELAPITMNAKAKAILSSYFYEIYQNSFSHSDSLIDVFSCGYWMKNQLVFSIYDMGVGIPYNVQCSIDKSMTSEECVEWAFREGTTTLDETVIKRGLGLHRLEKFIILNNGIMSMYTDNVCYTIDKGNKKIVVLSKPIKGTLIIISIRADNEHIYVVE